MTTTQEQLIESATEMKRGHGAFDELALVRPKSADDVIAIIEELHSELDDLHTHLDAMEVHQKMRFPESDEKDNGYETEEDQRKDTDAYAKGSFLLIVLFVVCTILGLMVGT